MKPDDNKTESLSDAAQRRRQQLLSMATTEIAANPSLGERLLPFLLAAMALSVTSNLHTLACPHHPLMGPFCIHRGLPMVGELPGAT